MTPTLNGAPEGMLLFTGCVLSASRGERSHLDFRYRQECTGSVYSDRGHLPRFPDGGRNTAGDLQFSDYGIIWSANVFSPAAFRRRPHRPPAAG